MGQLEDRIKRLEERLVLVPSIQECLDASNRERVRALHMLAQRLAPCGFDGDYLFPEGTLRMLSADTPEEDRETIEAWYRAQGMDRAAELEGAKERLLARLKG